MRIVMRCCAVAVALSFASVAVAEAQDPAPRTVPPRAAPRTQPDSAEAADAMSAMMPMWGRMMTAMMRGTLAVLAEPETAQQMAAFNRNYFDALVAKGFTRAEALQIVIAVGVPMGAGGR